MYGWTNGIFIGLLISLGFIGMAKLKFKFTSTGAHIRHGHQQERYISGSYGKKGEAKKKGMSRRSLNLTFWISL